MMMDHSSAESFGQLAAELYDLETVDLTVEGVVQFALQAVWCTCASVVLIARGRRPEIMALTDPKLSELYEGQIQAKAGPLLTVIEDGKPLEIPDVARETRWSAEWVETMDRAGLRSSMHLPLLVGASPQAVLNLYSDQPHGFDDDDLAVAHILAQHASVAIAGARRHESMVQAIDARQLIGQAIGILMERYDLDDLRAFEVLKRYSQDHNRKLREVAAEVAATRSLPA